MTTPARSSSGSTTASSCMRWPCRRAWVSASSAAPSTAGHSSHSRCARPESSRARSAAAAATTAISHGAAPVGSRDSSSSPPASSAPVPAVSPVTNRSATSVLRSTAGPGTSSVSRRRSSALAGMDGSGRSAIRNASIGISGVSASTRDTVIAAVPGPLSAVTREEVPGVIDRMRGETLEEARLTAEVPVAVVDARSGVVELIPPHVGEGAQDRDDQD